MRDRSLDRFESIFEKASIPVLEIEEVALERLSAVLNGDVLDETMLGLGRYLAHRFHAALELLHPSTVNVEAMLTAAREADLEPLARPFHSNDDLVEQLGRTKSGFVLFPAPYGPMDRNVELDRLVQGFRPPVLIIRKPVGDPAAVFRSVLHSLTGNFQQTQNFSYSFTLARRDSRLLLLHTIDDAEIGDVRDALQVSTDITDQTGGELLDALSRHGERFLKGVVAAGKDRPFEVSYRLAVGDVVSAVRGALETGSFTMLVVGTHVDGKSHVSAGDYQLMHVVQDIPVLAL